MKILAIETSCDETSCAIVKNGSQILSNIVSSQMKQHRRYGGVVPELASRMHTENLNRIIDLALQEASLEFKDLDAIAATQGPGLEGALLIGFTAAKTLAAALELPFYGVHHHYGHVYSAFLTETPPSFPLMALVVSGGHTQLIYLTDHFKAQRIAQTRDDAAGEAFDKIARVLNLGYPGGPVIEKAAQTGNASAFSFPRAMKQDATSFSFSGLKTAVIQTVQRLEPPYPIEDLAASFQQAVIDSLLAKTIPACLEYHCSTLILCGGVSANQALRDQMTAAASKHNITVIVPPLSLCTDNAAMIGATAFYMHSPTPLSAMVNANLPL